MWKIKNLDISEPAGVCKTDQIETQSGTQWNQRRHKRVYMVYGKGSDVMGGGGTKVQNIGAQYAQASPEQNKLLQNQMDWFSNLSPSINQLTNFGSSSLSKVPQYDYGQMYSNNMPQQNQIQAGFNGLTQGKLPDGFADQQGSYITGKMGDAMGSTMAKWADKGLVNSSLAQRAFGDVQGWASEQLQKNHLNNMSAAGTALGNSQQALWSPMQYASEAQDAAMKLPTQAFRLAGQLNQPIADLLAQLMDQQTAMSSPAQTIVSQKESPWGAIAGLAGSLGGAAIACFPAGSMISTPRGDVPIESIKEQSVLYGEDYQDEVVIETYEAVKDKLYTVITDKGVLRTTKGQRLMMPEDELKRIEDVQIGDQLIYKESYAQVQDIQISAGDIKVYELDTTGRNLFWVDGFLVEGMV